MDWYYTLLSYTLLGGVIGYITNFIAIKRIFMKNDLKIGPVIIVRQGIIYQHFDDILKKFSTSVDNILSVENIKNHVLTPEIKHRLLSAIAAHLNRNYRFIYRTKGRLILKAVLAYMPALVEGAKKCLDTGEITNNYLSTLDLTDLERLINENTGNSLVHLKLAGLYLGSAVGFVQGIVVIMITII